MPDEMNKREVILTIREYENSVAMPEGERETASTIHIGNYQTTKEGGHMPDEMNKREVILTIREYENSVAMPEGERVTYLDPRGGVHLKDGDDKVPDYMGHAVKCAEYLRFGDEVDAVTCGEYPRSSAVKFCDTPELFVQAGFRPLPMLYTQRHLRDAIRPKSSYDPHRHGLTVEQMKRLPELMEHPVMLCDSPARDDTRHLRDAIRPKSSYDPHRHGLTVEQMKRLPELMEHPVMLCDSPARDDTMLVVLRDVDCDDLPLIMAVRPDGRGYYEAGEIETNFILAVYGRTNFPRYFDNLITPDRVVYYDEERGHMRSYTCFGATSSNPTSIGLLYADRSA